MMRSLSLAALALGLLSTPAVSQELDLGSVPTGRSIRLKLATFDPLQGEPAMPAALRAGDDVGLSIVQFLGAPTDADRAAIRDAGAELHGYLPDHSYVVRAPRGVASRLAGLARVRWVGSYHPAYRLEVALLADLLAGVVPAQQRYNAVVVDKRVDKPALAARVEAIGARVTNPQPGSILFEVELDAAQLLQFVGFDEVLWVERWTAPEEDMNNARIQGGGDYIEAQGGYTGTGIVGHVYEGVEATHSDFTNTPVAVLSSSAAANHGHCTAGIVYGNGTSNPRARGMAPDASFFFTNYSTVNAGVSRWQVVQELVTNRDVMLTTASWGDARTRSYTAVSADADDIIFDHGIVWTQSQSNAGNQDSRPQAWAKNIFSIGGVAHRDNSDRSDDSWAAGGGSTGPAADGRIKPDLCAYYDAILCSDRTGSLGYASGDFYTSFGGTSGATPIVAGHNALAIQMFTDHIFNNPPRVPGGTRFQNRPKFSTLKALMIANARQYPFTSTSSDNRREHVGWGFPDLKTMLTNAPRMFVVDETTVLAQGQSATFPIQVGAADQELKVAMTFAEPAGNPAAAQAAINDLTLKVTSPSGTVYWGNHGLTQGNYSTSGGAANTVDSVECVLVNGPEVGTWTVEVQATLVVQDSHVETPAVDADFALCVSFGTANGGITEFGQGCLGTGQLPPICAGVNTSGGALTNSTASNEYAYQVSATTALSVDSFEVFSATTSGGNVTVTAAIYASAGSSPAVSPLATTTITIGGTAGFYRATFTAPVSIPAGVFYVAVDHSARTTYLANLSVGTAGVGYYRRVPLSGTWSRSGIIRVPSVRVLCRGAGGNATPRLSVAGVPEIGQTLNENLTLAATNSPAVLVTGYSDQTWAGGTLPQSLAGYGAPGCSLFVSTEITLGFTTSSNGGVAYALAIPSSTSLVGADLFQQFVVIDTGANALGVAVSNAIKIDIGG